MKPHNTNEKGITLLVTLLLMGVLLGVSASLMSITLKQFQLSGIAYSSEVAFQAANAGMECILYHDFNTDSDSNPVNGIQSPFEVKGDGTTVPEEGSISCMGQSSADVESSNNNTVVSGEEQKFVFSWGNPAVCSDVSVFKYYSTSADIIYTISGQSKTCPRYSTCTVVQARGYNVGCNDRATNPRVVEREYTQVY